MRSSACDSIQPVAFLGNAVNTSVGAYSLYMSSSDRLHGRGAKKGSIALQARRDTPVDVQVGPFLWEDAPQELRSRLWIALLCNPHLIGNLVEEKVRILLEFSLLL